jgi:hypothetical protein
VISNAAKAWISLLGSIITALLGLSVLPLSGGLHTGLTVASAVLTAVITYSVRNGETPVVPADPSVPTATSVFPPV